MNLLELQRRMSQDVMRPLTDDFAMQATTEQGLPLAEVARVRDDVEAVRLVDPLDGDRSIKPAAIRQNHLVACHRFDPSFPRSNQPAACSFNADNRQTP